MTTIKQLKTMQQSDQDKIVGIVVGLIIALIAVVLFLFVAQFTHAGDYKGINNISTDTPSECLATPSASIVPSFTQVSPPGSITEIETPTSQPTRQPDQPTSQPTGTPVPATPAPITLTPCSETNCGWK